MDDLTSDTLGPRVVDVDAERLEQIRTDAAAYVRGHARDPRDAEQLLAALGLPTITTPEDSHV